MVSHLLRIGDLVTFASGIPGHVYTGTVLYVDASPRGTSYHVKRAGHWHVLSGYEISLPSR
jgi:hypothetical protein